jgi:hypothetical protein
LRQDECRIARERENDGRDTTNHSIPPAGPADAAARRFRAAPPERQNRDKSGVRLTILAAPGA